MLHDVPLAGIFDGAGTLDSNTGSAAYLIVFALVAGDGILPVLPGETTVNTAAVLAGAGDLSLPLVIVAAGLGAMAGDSVVYMIGRWGSDRIRGWLVRGAGQERVNRVEDLFRRRGPLIVALGRFVPGLRVVTSFTAGATEMAMRRYLPALALGAFAWAVYASMVGYLAGQAFDGRIWISVAVSLVASAALFGTLAYLERRSRLATDGGRE